MGKTTNLLRENGYRPVGADLSLRFLQEGKATIPHYPAVDDNGHKLPFGSGSVDAVCPVPRWGFRLILEWCPDVSLGFPNPEQTFFARPPSWDIIPLLMGFFARAVQKGFRALGFELRRVRPENTASSYSKFNEEALIAKYLAQLPPRPRYCVDIGAGDGETMSNSYALIRDGWEGLALEYDGGAFSRLAYRYSKFPRCALGRLKVTPENVQDVFKAAHVPRDFSFLSLDIDSFDHFVLEKILEAYQPGLLCVEINEKIPPPVKFSVLWNPDYKWNEDHFYGQSLSLLAELGDRFRYVLVDLEYNNAFLAPAEAFKGAMRTVREVYEAGYLHRPDRHSHFPWNRDMEEVHALPPDQMVEFVKQKFSRYSGRVICRL